MELFRANDETSNVNEHNMAKNPNWREADQLAIYKHDRGVELGSTKKQLRLSGQSGIQVRRPDHSATLPPTLIKVARFLNVDC